MLKLKSLFSEKYNVLSENERDIFRYVLENPISVSKMTINELSHIVHVSNSSISRFTQKLGFSGFGEFKYYILEGINEASEMNDEIVDGDYLFEDFLKTKKLFKQSDVIKLLTWINEAEIIYCYGTGMGQRTVIQEFIRKMLPCKKIMINIEAVREMEYYIQTAKPNDIVMIFSLSGNVQNLITPISMFKQKKVHIVGVSQLRESILSDICDFNLYMQSSVFASDIDDYVSFLPMHYLTDLIVVNYRRIYFKEEG